MHDSQENVSIIGRGLTRRAALRWSGPVAASVAGGAGFGRTVVAEDATPVGTSDDTLVIGALLDLSGGWSELGIASQAALQLAAEDINAELAQTGSPVRVQVVVEDTQLERDLAEEHLRSFADQGIQVVVGPQSSAEAAAILDVTAETGVTVISQGSTASSLATPDDNLFRVVPTDVAEVEAVIRLLEEDGVQVIVPIWREDEGNQSLHDSMARLFPERGGTMLDGASYAPGTEDFSAVLADVNTQVEQAVQDHGADAVAVYVTAFDEIVTLFTSASEEADLSSFNWYGSNGTARLGALVEDAGAAAFAAETGYAAALLGLSDELSQRAQPIADRIEGESGEAPDTFGLAAYDAAWIATLAFLETGRSGDPAAFQTALANTADRYYGITGVMTLDEAGDRSTGDFDFWAVREADGGYEWYRAAQYNSVTGAIARNGDRDDATPAN